MLTIHRQTPTQPPQAVRAHPPLALAGTAIIGDPRRFRSIFPVRETVCVRANKIQTLFITHERVRGDDREGAAREHERGWRRADFARGFAFRHWQRIHNFALALRTMGQQAFGPTNGSHYGKFSDHFHQNELLGGQELTIRRTQYEEYVENSRLIEK